MNIADNASQDVNTNGGGTIPPCTGLAPDALPEVQEPSLAKNSQTGVSTRNVLRETVSQAERKNEKDAHWYALRTTYGREKKAYDYLVSKHIEAFHPTIKTIKLIDGKRKSVEESRIPNIFFAYGTEEEIKTHVYDNVHLPYLRFYYRHYHEGAQIIRKPLIVPNQQINSLKIICASEAEDIIIESSDIPKFKTGQTVRVIDGIFKGVIGKVARYKGQQRVGIVIDGLLTVTSAYVPSVYLENVI